VAIVLYCNMMRTLVEWMHALKEQGSRHCVAASGRHALPRERGAACLKRVRGRSAMER